MSGIGAGSPLRTVEAFLVGSVSSEMSRLWGECLWTAPELAGWEFSRLLRSEALREALLAL